MALQSWPRKHFQAGGGNAFVMYQVFGRFGKALDVSAEKHRTEGIPEGIKIQHYERSRHPDTFGWFKPGYLWDILQEKQPALAVDVDGAPNCLRIQGGIQDPPTLDYLRDVIGVITAVLEGGGRAVFDPQMFQWWSPVEWQTHVFNPDGPVPRHHVTILTSKEEGDPRLEWIHTRGMRKFGRPDLSIHSVPSEQRDAIVELCNRFIELQAFGGIISEGQPIRMAQLPEGMTCHHGGSLEDPDFNNVHVEIRRPATRT